MKTKTKVKETIQGFCVEFKIGEQTLRTDNIKSLLNAELFKHELDTALNSIPGPVNVKQLSRYRDEYLAKIFEISFTKEKQLKPKFQNVQSYHEIITKHFLEFVQGKTTKENNKLGFVVDVLIDANTLPENNQLVQFDTTKEMGLIGTFTEGDNLFLIGNGNYRTSHEVCSWRAIDKE